MRVTTIRMTALVQFSSGNGLGAGTQYQIVCYGLHRVLRYSQLEAPLQTVA